MNATTTHIHTTNTLQNRTQKIMNSHQAAATKTIKNQPPTRPETEQNNMAIKNNSCNKLMDCDETRNAKLQSNHKKRKHHYGRRTQQNLAKAMINTASISFNGRKINRQHNNDRLNKDVDSRWLRKEKRSNDNFKHNVTATSENQKTDQMILTTDKTTSMLTIATRSSQKDYAEIRNHNSTHATHTMT